MTDAYRTPDAPESITIDVPSEADWDEFVGVNVISFASTGGEAEIAVERLGYEPDRSLIARRAGEAVGSAGIMTRELSVPGAVVPAAHVTFVAVLPTARRQGILTRFMHRQFADIRAADESIAVLWASEARIYQRFGYGLAAVKLGLTVNNRELTLPAPSAAGTLTQAEPARVRPALAQVYAAAQPDRPGWSSRGERQWDRAVADPEPWRGGATTLRAVVHTGAGGPDGYALWRVLDRWGDTGPDGVVRIRELVATNPEAYRTLWRFLLDIDLTRTVEHWCTAVDEPLLTLASDPGRLSARLTDALWLRLVDLPAALSARRYPVDVDVVLEVSDALIPVNAGRWRLRGSPLSASCEPTTEEPDLRCDVRALASAYLGGTSFGSLTAGGLVAELRPGALAAASAAFGWHRAPSSVEVF